jgi:glutamate formiminotransferase/formiminotetrahydrofolate cyclodeaminase
MLVECVPNFSEGRNAETIDAIRAAIAGVPDVTVLDVSSDESHNRTVLTLVAPAERALEAAFLGIREATRRIDLRTHKGEHPRMGATDVVPFIPLEGATMEDCVNLARRLGERVGRELEIPVYLYERAATRPERENLADVRRGEFEGIRDSIATDPARAPDFGPTRTHPTAGAVAIGARPFLVAYNIYLGGTEHLPVAKAAAKAVRGSSGGLRYVKGLGLEVDSQAQVSMNLVDIDKTPAHRAFELVKSEAETGGASITWSEIVGLVPERVLFDAAIRYLRLGKFTLDQILERRVRQATRGGPSLDEWVSSVASASPTPGGGSVAAHAGALAAALAQMVAGLTVGRKKYASVDAEFRSVAADAATVGQQLRKLVDDDAAAYGTVSAAYKLPKDTPEQTAARDAAITEALLAASRVPLETARACRKVAVLAEAAAARGNSNAISDAGVAALLADAAARGAAYNVRINVAALPDRSLGSALVEEAQRVTEETSETARRVTELVERAM